MGSNLGDRRGFIEAALRDIGALAGTRVLACSGLIETDAVGPGAQGAYLNGAARLETTLPPRELLTALLAIEAAHGRDRAGEPRWGARTLDLDILLYGERIIDEPGLSVPHPRLHERAFVLIPLAQIASDLVLPGHEKTPRELLGTLECDA